MTNSSPVCSATAPRRTALSFLAALAALAVLLLPGRAFASTWALKTTEVTESSGEWHIKVRIDLSRPPQMMHIPMRFTFSKEAVDERAIMSKGAEPQHHRVVLETSQKQIVSLDVDFADPSGKVFKSTYFEFDLARKDGYFEAGEYTMVLAGPDGDIPGTGKLILKGDNPPVYRGAMDFAGDPKDAKKKKGVNMENVSSGIDGGAQVAQNDTPSSAGPASTDVASAGPAPDMIGKGAYSATPEEESVKDHPSGCGCFVGGVDSGTGALGLGAMGLLGLAIASRRSQRRT
jgi:hypothetical protein